MNENITITVPVEIPIQRIADTLCAALEGGCTYWCQGCDVDWTCAAAKGDNIEWAHEAIANGAFGWVRVLGEDDKVRLGGKDKIKAALALMATKHPDDFKDMMEENEDADTGDILFQLMCFGEIVYG